MLQLQKAGTDADLRHGGGASTSTTTRIRPVVRGGHIGVNERRPFAITCTLLALGLSACDRDPLPNDQNAQDAAADASVLDGQSVFPETCKDKAKNNGETDIDCGGPCPPCAP